MVKTGGEERRETKRKEKEGREEERGGERRSGEEKRGDGRRGENQLYCCVKQHYTVSWGHGMYAIYV